MKLGEMVAEFNKTYKADDRVVNEIGRANV